MRKKPEFGGGGQVLSGSQKLDKKNVRNVVTYSSSRPSHLVSSHLSVSVWLLLVWLAHKHKEANREQKGADREREGEKEVCAQLALSSQKVIQSEYRCQQQQPLLRRLI